MSGRPRYGSSYDESYGAAMWQYTSTGSVSGISGNVDRNYLFKDYTGLIPVRTQAEASWLEKNSEQEEAGEETPEKEDPPSSAPALRQLAEESDGMVVPQRGRQLSCGLLAAD